MNHLPRIFRIKFTAVISLTSLLFTSSLQALVSDDQAASLLGIDHLFQLGDVSDPQVSPDGKFLAFLSARDKGKTQVWSLFREGGEAVQLTDTAQSVSAFEWPPDGSKIAFTSNRTENPDSNYNTDIWVVPSDLGTRVAELTRVSQSPGPDASPAWSPDGKLIAHTSLPDTSAMLYGTSRLAVSSAKAGNSRVQHVVTPTLILGGEKDWNVPIINSEQLYIALNRRGVETKLIVYPGEYHGDFVPSHSKDLYQRYLDWFGDHLKTP